jgi:DNA-binding winged helix-turn-helix (wHTH) protein
MRFRFADFVLDEEQFELRRGADVVPLEPQVLKVIAYLAHHSDRVVP